MTKTYESNYRKFLLQHTEENITDLFKTGVYEIVNKVNGKKYIGSAAQDRDDCDSKLGFYVRWYLHVTDLQAEDIDHHCQHLQRAWNKYGHENFEFRILEYCHPDDCISLEQYYLDSYWDRGILYNTCRTAGSNKDAPRTEEWRRNIGEAHAKDWEFISPEGELVQFRNLAEFCRKNNLGHTLMSAVYLGKSTHHKGWSAVGSGYIHLKYEFVSPEGVTYKFSDLANFCKENGLSQPGMSAVHHGYRNVKQYKGWHLPGEKPEEKVYYLLSPEGEVVTTTNLRSLCEKHGLNSGSLSQMLLGNLNHHKGWSTPERPYNPEVKKILSPDGVVFEFTNTKAFCDERGLCHKSMSAVLNAKRNHYKQWSRPDSPYREKEVINYRFISPEGIEYTTNNLKTFGEVHELDPKKLSRLYRGLMTHHKGWVTNN